MKSATEVEVGTEDSCPSCNQILVCRTTQYKDNLPKNQWQYKDREEAHFSFDSKTRKSACKESSSDGPKASTTQSSVSRDKIDLSKIDLPSDQVVAITEQVGEITDRELVILAEVTRRCNNAGTTHPATIGMIFNQVNETRRYKGV
jgi:hypothetical protein